MAGRLLTLITAAGLAVLAAGAFPAAASAVPPSGTTVSGKPAVDPASVVIARPEAAHSYRFDLLLPPGGRLSTIPADTVGGTTTGAVLVRDSAGKPVGAYDAPWAADALGRPLATSYRVAGSTLIQTVAFDARTRFPVTIDPIYSQVGRATAPLAATPLKGTAFSGLARPSKVTVPANYVYNPALGSYHDYCTDAPDEFPAPGAPNADFRGPCARHDLCYEGGTTSRFSCDNTLLSNLDRNCEYYYGVFSLLRASCKATALVYWAAVVVS
jgi:hypothetical protein